MPGPSRIDSRSSSLSGDTFRGKLQKRAARPGGAALSFLPGSRRKDWRPGPFFGNAGNNGNLYSVTQSNGGPGYGQFLSFQQTYGYDNVNRLSQIYENPPGNASPYWYRTFNYDDFGNMWVSATSGLAAPVLTPQASSAFNSATNRLTMGSYDAAGNQTVFSNFTAVYDAENRQTAVTDGTSGNQMTYRYDGNGQRVIKGNTVYVYDAFSQLVAQYNNYPVSSVTCTTCYLSVDHLGSTRLVTDQ